MSNLEGKYITVFRAHHRLYILELHLIFLLYISVAIYDEHGFLIFIGAWALGKYAKKKLLDFQEREAEECLAYAR